GFTSRPYQGAWGILRGNLQLLSVGPATSSAQDLRYERCTSQQLNKYERSFPSLVYLQMHVCCIRSQCNCHCISRDKGSNSLILSVPPRRTMSRTSTNA